MERAHNMWGGYLYVIAVLCFVILLIWGSRYLLMYFFRSPLGSKKMRDLSIEESLILDQKRRIILISYQKRKALLLIGGNNDVFLGWVEDTESKINI